MLTQCHRGVKHVGIDKIDEFIRLNTVIPHV